MPPPRPPAPPHTPIPAQPTHSHQKTGLLAWPGSPPPTHPGQQLVLLRPLLLADPGGLGRGAARGPTLCWRSHPGAIGCCAGGVGCSLPPSVRARGHGRRLLLHAADSPPRRRRRRGSRHRLPRRLRHLRCHVACGCHRCCRPAGGGGTGQPRGGRRRPSTAHALRCACCLLPSRCRPAGWVGRGLAGHGAARCCSCNWCYVRLHRPACHNSGGGRPRARVSAAGEHGRAEAALPRACPIGAATVQRWRLGAALGPTAAA